MNKTAGEAADFLDALRARDRRADARRRRRLPALSRRSPPRSSGARHRRSRSPPRTCTSRVRARSPARSRPRCCADARRRGAIVGHSERRQLFGETDEALARKVPGALGGRAARRSSASARPRPSATRARPRRVLAAQLEADLAERRRRRGSAEVVIAYEPIWAIGTGRTATAEQAQEACAFIRGAARRERRRRGRCGADPLRRLGEARQRRRAARAAGHRRRPGRRRQPRRRRLRRDRRGGRVTAMIAPGADRLPAPSVALIVLDGWGLARARARQRGLAGRDAGLRRALGALPAHDALGERARRRAARRPDGQLRGRPSQPRRRRGRQAGPGADRRRGRRRHASSRTRRCSPPARRARRARAGGCT